MGWQYLLLFLILTAPLVFWLWHITAQTMKVPYDDEFKGLV